MFFYDVESENKVSFPIIYITWFFCNLDNFLKKYKILTKWASLGLYEIIQNAINQTCVIGRGVEHLLRS